MNRLSFSLVAFLTGCAHLQQSPLGDEQGVGQLYQPPPRAEQEVLQQVLDDQTSQVRGDFYLLSELRWSLDTRGNTFENWSATLWPAGWRRTVPDSLLRRFWDANLRPKAVRDVHLSLGPRLRLLRPGRKPGDAASVLTLSRAAFSSAGDSVLVAARFICPGLCGSDEILLYVRKRGAWSREMFVHVVQY